MTKTRVEKVQNVTEEALNELQTRLEKMPQPTVQLTDPKGMSLTDGITVQLLYSLRQGI